MDEVREKDFELNKIEYNLNEGKYYSNAQRGADKIMTLITKYPKTFDNFVNKANEIYSRRITYGEHELSTKAIDDMRILAIDIKTRLEKGFIKIKRFNFEKELNPIEKGILGLLGILGISNVITALLDFKNLTITKIISFIFSINNIFFTILAILFIFLLFYIRYEP